MEGNVLLVKEVTKSFGGLTAVDHVSLSIAKNKICGLIGPNGSGKTTFFNLISGVLKVTSGEIYFKNERIENADPFKITRKGLGRTFQLVRLFPRMNVLENLIAVHSNENRLKDIVDRAFYALAYVGLEKQKDEYVRNLSLGDQKKLEFCRTLMFDSELILLDEPTSGADYDSIEKIIMIVRKLRDEGKTFFIIEHNMRVAMNLCEYIFVLNHGVLISQGAPMEIKNDQLVIESYLGKK